MTGLDATASALAAYLALYLLAAGVRRAIEWRT